MEDYSWVKKRKLVQQLSTSWDEPIWVPTYYNRFKIQQSQSSGFNVWTTVMKKNGQSTDLMVIFFHNRKLGGKQLPNEWCRSNKDKEEALLGNIQIYNIQFFYFSE